MDKPTLYYLIGISGSGKTTTRNHLIDIKKADKYVNADELRIKIHDIEDQFDYRLYFALKEELRKKEEIVWHELNRSLIGYMKQGFNIVHDNTNLDIKSYMTVKEYCKQYGYDLILLLNHTPLDKCIERVKNRIKSDGVGPPTRVIKEQYEKFKYIKQWLERL